MHNIHHTAYQSSTRTELRLANIKFKSQVLLKVALQKIPPMVPATIKSTFKPNDVLAININRMIPCTHAFALILRLNYLFPLVFRPQFYSVQTWHNTYSSNFRPIVFTPHVQYVPPPGLHTESEKELACNAPRTHIPRGRPKKERYRRGEGRQHAPRAQEHLCSPYGQPGHNSRTCRTPHD